MAKKVCLYFQVHQPERLKEFDFFDIGVSHDYFNDSLNEEIINKVSASCYLPANDFFEQLIHLYPDELKIAFSLSGVVLDQFERFSPHVISSFQNLIKTGNVELLGETYYHSLASVYSKVEFHRQVELHRAKIKEVFDVSPQIFRNTELIFSNEITEDVHQLGFKAMIAEGVCLPHKGQLFYTNKENNLPILFRDINRSDDLAFRFSDTSWESYPLQIADFIGWVNDDKREVVNVFIDYETLGEHQNGELIFDFLKGFIGKFISEGGEFVTPSEQLSVSEIEYSFETIGETSWADEAKDLSAWCGNEIQKESLKRVFDLEQKIKAIKDVGLLSTWSKLLTSDHFYYMSTKHKSDGNVHQFFSPYNSPFDGYVFLSNIICDLELRLR